MCLLASLSALPVVARAGPTGVTRLTPDNAGYALRKERIVARFAPAVPHQWGTAVTEVKTRLDTPEKLLALTLDACGSPGGTGFDAELLAFLERERVPATLFVTPRWIAANRSSFARLAANPLFEIANHVLRHRPASVTGRSAYGIGGTRDVAELVDEIELAAAQIAALTGRRPQFYRPGTAFCDEVAVQIAAVLGQQVVGFAVLGDAGATYTREEVRRALLGAKPGDIVILHMNHPDAGTRAGAMDAIPELLRRGFRFVHLSARPLR